MGIIRAKVISNPAQRISSAKIAAKIEHELGLAAAGMMSDFRQIQSNWDARDQATFKVRSLPGSVEVVTKDVPFIWVDAGTKKHTISPLRGDDARLVFHANYVPRTQAGVLRSGRRQDGGPLILATRVKHPGIAARGFSAMIAKRWQTRFAKRVRDMLEREANK